MKKYPFMVLAAAAAAMISCSEGKGYRLSCEVPEAWEGKTAVLCTDDTGETIAVDSTAVKNGSFTFKGEFKDPRYCKVTVYLNPKDRRSRDMSPSFHVYLDSTAVSAHAENGKTVTFVTEGGATMEEWKQYLAEAGRIQDQRKALFNEYIDLFYEKELEREGVYAALAVSSKAGELQDFRISFIRQHPESMLSLQVLREILGLTNDLGKKELTDIFSGLSPQIRETAPATALLQAIQERQIEKGAPCPDVQVEDRNGKTRHLSEFIGKGRYTLVELWASWCAPCRGEIPFIRRAWKKYHPKGLEIVSLSMNSNRSDWEKALDEEDMPWMQLIDTAQKSFDAFETNAVPTSLLVDPDGNIFRLGTRGGWLDAALEEIYSR